MILRNYWQIKHSTNVACSFKTQTLINSVISKNKKKDQKTKKKSSSSWFFFCHHRRCHLKSQVVAICCFDFISSAWLTSWAVYFTARATHRHNQIIHHSETLNEATAVVFFLAYSCILHFRNELHNCVTVCVCLRWVSCERCLVKALEFYLNQYGKKFAF